MYCCISGCYNTSKNNSKDVKFYYFPTNSTHMPWLRDKRIKWINAVLKHTRHPNNWLPSKNTTICSAHFIGNKKSNNPLHPSYLPTIFPGQDNIKSLDQKIERFERHQRRMQRAGSVKEDKSCQKFRSENNFELESQEPSSRSVGWQNDNISCGNEPQEPSSRSVGCQNDNISGENEIFTPFFLSNLFNFNGVCTAEVQCNIVSKTSSHKSCEANIVEFKKIMKDFSCDPIDQHSQILLCPGFHGISSMKTDENLINTAGVSFSVFNLLLNLLPDVRIKFINKKTKLLITLMKLKTGLRFSALSVIFQIHRTTVQRIFETYLFLLHSVLKKFIPWPSKSTVQSNMPESFKIYYPNTRVIIDCTEIHTECPATVKQRVQMYSDYKHGYTVKFLVGCTPCGFISFVSKCYGGRSSDCFITNHCGVLDLLEPGDTILADKGFPAIKTSVGKKEAILVMPPFLHEQQFSPEEVEETYKIASLRIHIERVIQRIKQFHIFDKIPISLLKYRDQIVRIVCALVNVENPIIKQ